MLKKKKKKKFLNPHSKCMLLQTQHYLNHFDHEWINFFTTGSNWSLQHCLVRTLTLTCWKYHIICFVHHIWHSYLMSVEICCHAFCNTFHTLSFDSVHFRYFAIRYFAMQYSTISIFYDSIVFRSITFDTFDT